MDVFWYYQVAQLHGIVHALRQANRSGQAAAHAKYDAALNGAFIQPITQRETPRCLNGCTEKYASLRSPRHRQFTLIHWSDRFPSEQRRATIIPSFHTEVVCGCLSFVTYQSRCGGGAWWWTSSKNSISTELGARRT